MTAIALQTNPALLAQAKPLPETDMNRIEEAAKEFEAMFFSEMMKPMFESIKTNGPFGGGKGEEIFRSFLRDEYGKIVAGTGSLGIADLVKQQLIEIQAKSIKPELAQNMHGNSVAIRQEDQKDVL